MITRKNLCFLLVFNLVCLKRHFADESADVLIPNGHLEPLGSHRVPDAIEERLDVPNPLEFWLEYVKISKPVVFRGAAKHSKAYKLWTDDYLKENYGDLEVRLESKGEKSGRVPIGVKGLGRDTIANFVNTYHDTNCYIVSELPSPMWNDISVQPCLTCGTFADRIVEIDLWMSGGGSKSLLHKDAFNAINCLYNGTKEWKMIEYKYEKMIYKAWEPDYEVGGYSLLDVDSVDLVKHPKVKDVPWSFVTVNAGDCLFLPKSYYHQVNSYGSNNIAVAILFSRLDNLQQYNNTGCESNQLNYIPLSHLDVDWKYPGYGKMTMGNTHLETAREMFNEAVQRGPLTLESISLFLKEFLPRTTISESLARKVFNILSKNGQVSIKEEDIASLSKDDLRQLLLIIERYEPSNTYTYEYSYVREYDIRLLIDTCLKQDGVVILEKFVEAYQEHLGGTKTFAIQLFRGLQPKNESVATAKEVQQNLDTVLKPYIEYRIKSGIDDDVDDSEGNDDNGFSNDQNGDIINDNHYDEYYNADTDGGQAPESSNSDKDNNDDSVHQHKTKVFRDEF